MKQLTLPFLLLVALVVGYCRWTGAERDLGNESYRDLVKATQAPDAGRDAGTALACTAAFTAPPKQAPPDADGGSVSDARISELLREGEERSAVLDRLSLDELLQQAQPGELDHALVRRARARSQRSELEEDVLLHWELDAELSYGTFHRFFFDAKGDRALRTREAVERIGPPELLALFDCALTAFPGSKPDPNRDARNAQLAAWGGAQFELFDVLERSFSELPPLTAARERYIRARLKTSR